MPKKPILIEIDTRKATRVLFIPTGDKLRSRIDASKIDDDHRAGELRSIYPGGELPGMRIELDAETGTGAIVESLYSDAVLLDWAHRTARERGERMPPERDEHPHIDAQQWLFWMRRLVDGRYAKLLSGDLPPLSEISYRPPRRRPMHAAPPLDAQPAAV